jgi:hypothetical protein
LTSNACFSHFFSLLPLPTAAFSTIMAKRKATTEQLGARAESNGYKRGAHREKDSTRDNGKFPSVSQRRFKGLQESSLPKSRRNQHVHVCVRRELASKLEQLQSDIHYCYQCFEWVVGEHWNGHCQEHLSAITSKRCGSITYCHTLVRPGYCPFHLKNPFLGK